MEKNEKTEMTWKLVPGICQWCGKEFVGKKHQIYCSRECYDNATGEDFVLRKLGTIRHQKFMAALRYVEKHNLKEILKKYKKNNNKKAA